MSFELYSQNIQRCHFFHPTTLYGEIMAVYLRPCYLQHQPEATYSQPICANGLLKTRIISIATNTWHTFAKIFITALQFLKIIAIQIQGFTRVLQL